MYNESTNQVAKEKMKINNFQDLLKLQKRIYALGETKTYDGSHAIFEKLAYCEGYRDAFDVIVDFLNETPKIDGLNGSEEAQAIKSMTQSQTAEVK